MKIPTIGILSPGDMGHAIGRVLHQHGMRVLTTVRDRSERTHSLARVAGFQAVFDKEDHACTPPALMLPISRC